MRTFQGSITINLADVMNFIGPVEPFGQMVARKAFEAKVGTLVLLDATLDGFVAAGECTSEEADRVRESFGIGRRSKP